MGAGGWISRLGRPRTGSDASERRIVGVEVDCLRTGGIFFTGADTGVGTDATARGGGGGEGSFFTTGGLNRV